MKLLTLIRDDTSDEGTFSVGTLTAGDNRLGFWDFLELPWRDNRTGVSCIPPGLYEAHLTYSNRFQREVYILDGVPDRTAIEIHPANWAGDKAAGFYTELNGCLAPGMERGLLTPAGHNLMQRAVLQSGRAFQQLMDALAGDDIEVHILWANGVKP